MSERQDKPSIRMKQDDRCQVEQSDGLRDIGWQQDTWNKSPHAGCRHTASAFTKQTQTGGVSCATGTVWETDGVIRVWEAAGGVGLTVAFS